MTRECGFITKAWNGPCVPNADDFAALIDALAASGKSGHQYLTCGVTDEITVMVLHREYPENLRP